MARSPGWRGAMTMGSTKTIQKSRSPSRGLMDKHLKLSLPDARDNHKDTYSVSESDFSTLTNEADICNEEDNIKLGKLMFLPARFK